MNDVIEFIGKEGTGKSHLLMNIAVHCILPKSLSGCECDIIFISSDYKFDILQLVAIIEQKLKSLKIGNSLNDTLLCSILDRFHIFYSTSISDCCMSLMTIPYALSSVGAILFDNIGTFFLENKLHSARDSSIEHLIEILNKIHQDYNLVIIANQLSLVVNDVKPWVRLVKHRFKFEVSIDSYETNMFIQQIFPERGNSCQHIITLLF